MRGRTIMLGLAATSLLAASTLPALAQLDDFLCSTFSYKCAPPPAPPPPQLAPEAQPMPEPTKHAHKAHKRKVKAAKAKTDSTEGTASPESAAPPAADTGAPK